MQKNSAELFTLSVAGKYVTGYDPIASGKTDLRIETSFHNHTSRKITVCDRTGMRFVVLPDKQRRGICPADDNTGKFIIRKTFHMSAAVACSLDEYLAHAKIIISDNTEMEELISHWKAEIRDKRLLGLGPHGRDLYLTIEYCVEQYAIEKQGHLYYKQADVALSVFDPKDSYAHPGSSLAVNPVIFEDTVGSVLSRDNSTSMELRLEIITEDQAECIRYMNIGDQTIALKPKQDRTMLPGIYLTFKKNIRYFECERFKRNDSCFDVIRMDMKKAEEIGFIFKSEDMARLNMDARTLMSKNLDDEKYLQEIEKLKAKRQTTEMETKNLYVKSELEAKMLERKDKVEQAAATRQTVVDVVKIISVSVVGIFTLVKLFQK